MPRRKSFRPSLPTVFFGLMLLSAASSLLPVRLTDPLKNVFQPLLAPLSRASHTVALMAKRVSDMKAIDGAMARVSRAIYDHFNR